MKGIKDKISEYERIWEPKITESSESRFWKAVALSYIEQDVELETKQIFITQISFYPRLIETLISVLEKIGNSVKLKITFFSTLLPRHYWNFPINIKDGSMSEGTKTYSKSMAFLDTYREEICRQCKDPSNKKIKIDIQRILFLAEDSTVLNYGDTDLFLKKDFDTDFQYYCQSAENNRDSKIKWEQLASSRDRNGVSIVQNKRCLIDGNVDNLNLKKDILETDRKEEFVYKLSHRRSDKYDISVGDFYVNKLHTNPDENARYIILGTNVRNNNNEYTDQEKSRGHYKKTDIPTVSPNLSLIEISYTNDTGEPETLSYILDTYMDIKQEIVRLKIVKDKEDKVLADAIQKIILKSVPIKKTRKSNDKSKSLDKTMSSYLQEIELTIRSHINGAVTREIKNRGNYILENISNESSEQLQKYYELQQNKDEKDFIQEVSQQMGYNNR